MSQVSSVFASATLVFAVPGVEAAFFLFDEDRCILITRKEWEMQTDLDKKTRLIEIRIENVKRTPR